MDLFGRKTKQLRLEVNQIEENIKTSFSKVRDDSDTINAWLNYYYQRSLYFESRINQLLSTTNSLNSKVSDNNSSIKNHSTMINEIVDNTERIVEKMSSLQSDVGKTLTEDRLNFYIEKILR